MVTHALWIIVFSIVGRSAVAQCGRRRGCYGIICCRQQRVTDRWTMALVKLSQTEHWKLGHTHCGASAGDDIRLESLDGIGAQHSTMVCIMIIYYFSIHEFLDANH